MKVSITDKFLWDAYNFLEKTEDVLDFVLSSKYKKASILMGDENPVFRKHKKEMGKRKFGKMVDYMKRNNYIKVKRLEGKRAIIITKNGIDKILKASFKMDKYKKRKDGKWIMLMFDIPEKYKKSRNLLTSILKNFGYKIFQQSVWITPYDISEKTEKLLRIYSLDKFVKIFLIEKL